MGGGDRHTHDGSRCTPSRAFTKTENLTGTPCVRWRKTSRASVTRNVNGAKRDSARRRLFHVNAWVAVFAALFGARYVWVAALSAILSARYAYVTWYKRRRSALVES